MNACVHSMRIHVCMYLILLENVRYCGMSLCSRKLTSRSALKSFSKTTRVTEVTLNGVAKEGRRIVTS